METAARIADGDAVSWQQTWAELARRVEACAHACLMNGAVGEARSAYLRACSYYRAPLFVGSPHDLAFRNIWQKMHTCFRTATSLLHPPIEPIEVSVAGQRLSGYFWKPDTSMEAHLTLLTVGGIETFAETVIS